MNILVTTFMNTKCGVMAGKVENLQLIFLTLALAIDKSASESPTKETKLTQINKKSPNLAEFFSRFNPQLPEC